MHVLAVAEVVDALLRSLVRDLFGNRRSLDFRELRLHPTISTVSDGRLVP